MKYLAYLAVVFGLSAALAAPLDDYFRAVEVDDERSLIALIKSGIDPNTANDKGQTALHRALQRDSPRVANALLSIPAVRIDVPNAAGETPLMLALIRGNLSGAERLLGMGAAVNRDGWTPLHYAASSPEPRVVKLLIDRGAKIDAPSPNGSTALMMAARYGSEESVDLLLAAKADTGLRNERGFTAADFAKSAGRDKLAARLQPPAR